MAITRTEAAPAPAVPVLLPALVELSAAKAIDELAELAASSAAISLRRNDYQEQQLMKTAHDILGIMNDSVALGTPAYVFALTTSAGSGRVQALATVLVSEYTEEDDDEAIKVAEVVGLVASPSYHPGVGAELYNRICHWGDATEHLVTLDDALDDRIQRYYHHLVEWHWYYAPIDGGYRTPLLMVRLQL